MLRPQKGEKVLDLCSAPGGKGTQLAAYMQGEGLLVLNEPIFSRAKILSQNAERMGVKNALVTCAYPKDLANVFPNFFDKILVDAPCSGEGMFRKNAKEALAEWSEENVAICAARQREILSCAVKMLKTGGRIVYSTCTFSTEEDEEQVARFLQEYPNFRLVKQEKLYPHKVKGEGHFAALLEKTDGDEPYLPRLKKKTMDRATEKAFRDFEKEFFKNSQFKNITVENGILYALPVDTPEWGNLQVLRVGVRLGEMKNGRFEPDHSLAMCTKIDEAKSPINFPLQDPRVEKFLRGEAVEIDENKNGWKLVCVDGFPIGFGKNVNGTLKNHIPKGLRKLS
jgi:NOL1/NOP2/fmu family ribosome biogenesis protein/precorrin-6B methylase 2